MYCNKCGTENPDDAVYCKKCGALVEGEVETVVAKRTTPSAEAAATPPFEGGELLSTRPRNAATAPFEGGEPERIFSIAPTLKFVLAGYAAAVVAAFLLVALLTVFVPGFTPLIGVGVGVLLLFVPAYFHIKQKLVRYTLRDTTIEIDRGLIARTTQNVPLRRIQDVTVSATLFQRLLGYGDVTIDNASEDGGKVVLDNVDAPKKYADMILKQMRLLDR